jgi:hypothetical protein
LNEAWKRFETVTRATAAFCREQNVPLLYVIIPFPGKSEAEDPYSAPMKQLIASDLNLPYLPMHNLLTASHQLSKNDHHLNPEGNRVVAVAILERLLPYLHPQRF